MKRLTTIAFVAFFITGIFVSSPVPACAERDRPELKPLMRVRPVAHTFDCKIPARAKEIVVTNVSKQSMSIHTSADQSWISVTPGVQNDVPPAGTALFTVSVNCNEVKGTKPWTGNVVVQGMSFTQKVGIIAKPKLDAAPPRIK